VYASAAGVARRYEARTGDSATSQQVVQRIGSDPVADAVWGEAVDALAVALATLTLVVDPGAVLLGGGLARAGAALVSPLEAALSARLAWRPAPPLLLARLGALAGAVGAAEVASRAVVAGQHEGPPMGARSAAPAGAEPPSLAAVGSEQQGLPR
jgi:glucokinase